MRAARLLTALGIGGTLAAAWLVFEGSSDRPAGTQQAPTTGPVARPTLSGVDRPAPGPARAETVRISGVVRRDGAPRPARLELWSAMPAGTGTGARGRGFLRFDGSAFLWLRERGEVPLASAMAAGDGVFTFGDLVAGDYAVTARAEDGAAADAVLSVQVAGEHSSVGLALGRRDETLRGRVLGADGRPSQVRVVVEALESPGRTSVSLLGSVPVSTDEDGRFVVTGLARGKAQVAALDASGLRGLSGPVRLPHEGEFVFTLDADALEVTGQVVRKEDGRPLPEVEVTASPWSQPVGDRVVLPRTITDGQGRFQLYVPSASWRLVARAQGYVEGSVEPAARSVILKLSAEATFRGRALVEGTGMPVAGVRVTAFLKDDWLAESTSITDAEGRYELRSLVAGRYSVTARGGNWVSSNYLFQGDTPPDPYPLVVRAGEERVEDLLLVPAARVRGIVVDHEGAPVQGARISVTRPFGARSERAFEPVPWSAYWDRADVRATGADGRFELTALVPGLPYDIEVDPAGAASPPAYRVVTDAVKTPSIEVKLPRPRWVRLTVLAQESDAPIRDAHVRLFEAAPPAVGATDVLEEENLLVQTLRTAAEGHTDDSGRVRLGPVGLGEISAQVSGEGLVDENQTHTLGTAAADAEDLSLTVRVERGRTVAGRVLRPDGAPAVGASVMLRQDLGGGASRSTGVTADVDGRFEYEGVGRGTYDLEVRHSDSGEYAATLPVPEESADLVVRLSPGAGRNGLVLRVLDPEGRPVPAADASFHTKTRGSFHGTVRDGRVEFQLHDEEAGEELQGQVVIEFAKEHDGSPLPLGWTTRGRIRAGDVLEIRMLPERVITGRVIGPTGAGIPGVKVRADRVDAGDGAAWREQPNMWNDADAFVTDAKGAFRIGHLGDGHHRVYVLPPPEFTAPQSQKARAGASDVVFTIQHAVAVEIRVLDGEGKPVRGARVVVARVQSDPDDLTVANLFQNFSPGHVRATSGEGTVRFVGLDPARPHVLGVEPPRGRTDVAEHVDVEWSPADTVLRLAGGRVVAGTVRDALGEPLAGIFVTCERESGFETQTRTDKEGAFRFTALGEGRVTIEVTAMEDKRPRRRARQVVETGREDVELVLGR